MKPESLRADKSFVTARKAAKFLRDEIMARIDSMDEKTAIQLNDIVKTITDSQPKSIDENALVEKFSNLVSDKLSVKVEHITKNNNVVAKMTMPQEIIDVLSAMLSMILAMKEGYDLSDYLPHRGFEPTDTIGYYGYIHPSGAWYIVMNEENTKDGQQLYAFGDSDFEAAWQNMRKLKYKNIDEAMRDAGI